jgi:hypothetical protein
MSHKRKLSQGHETLYSELEELCSSDALCLEILKQKTDGITSDIFAEDSRNKFLYAVACRNPRVTVDILQHLEGILPSTNELNSALNLACSEGCPKPVIEHLAKKFPEAMSWGKFLPLHWYLTRSSIDNEVVKMLINIFPRALTNAANVIRGQSCTPLQVACLRGHTSVELLKLLTDDSGNCLQIRSGTDGSGFLPIHTLLSNPNVPLESVRYLAQKYPDGLLQKANGKKGLITPPLHIACRIATSFDVIQLIVKTRPESVRKKVNDYLPIHLLCWNVNMDKETLLKVLKLLHQEFPESLRMPSKGGRLLIHLVIIRKPKQPAEAPSTSICKYLASADPDTLCARDSAGYLPLHCACIRGSVELVQYLYHETLSSVRDSHPRNFLHVAVASKDNSFQIEIMNFLIHEDPDATSRRDRRRMLPIHHANTTSLSIASRRNNSGWSRWMSAYSLLYR